MANGTEIVECGLGDAGGRGTRKYKDVAGGTSRELAAVKGDYNGKLPRPLCYSNNSQVSPFRTH